MATDHAAPTEPEVAGAERSAYVSPAVDFLLVATLTTLVSVAGAVVITP